MGLALGPAFGRAELAVWGGWGARVCFGRGVLPRVAGWRSTRRSLAPARAMLYGLPSRLSLWHRRRSPFACRMSCVSVSCGCVPLRSALVWVLTF